MENVSVTDDNIRQQIALSETAGLSNIAQNLKLINLKENISNNIVRAAVLRTCHNVSKFLSIQK
jgi:hypothetical protein